MPSSEVKKKISVSIAPELRERERKTYHVFLVHSEEDSLQIDLAEKIETENQIEVTVKESVAIDADSMLEFALDIVNELIAYENKYKNKKGISIPESDVAPE